jgi:hypothetical protein
MIERREHARQHITESIFKEYAGLYDAGGEARRDLGTDARVHGNP